jgi:hypothetical protein
MNKHDEQIEECKYCEGKGYISASFSEEMKKITGLEGMKNWLFAMWWHRKKTEAVT